MSNPERRSLAGLAVESGVPVPCAGNLPLALDDPQCVWFIEKGTVDLFLVEHRDGEEQSAPEHLMRAECRSPPARCRTPGGKYDPQSDRQGVAGHLAAAPANHQPGSGPVCRTG